MKKNKLLLALVFWTAFPLLLGANGSASSTTLLNLQSDILEYSLRFLGRPYVYAAADPAKGFDCSGFIYYVYKDYARDIPKASRLLGSYGKSIPRDQIRPGDLLFYATGKDPSAISHVALYLGQNSMVHAASAGPKTGIIVTDLDEKYWKARFHSARRVTLPPQFVVFQELPGQSYTIRYARGVYEGPILHGEPHGQGRLTLNNGDVYQGSFHQGSFQGKGLYRSKEGEKYEGQFHLGKFHGQGTLTLRDGKTIQGVFSNNQVPPSAKNSPAAKSLGTRTLNTYQQPNGYWDNFVGPDFPEDWER